MIAAIVIATAFAIDCPDSAGWMFRTETAQSDGVEIFTVNMTSQEPSIPPAFEVRFSVPQIDIHHLWRPEQNAINLPQDFGGGWETDIARWMPLVALINDDSESRCTFAADETRRRLVVRTGLHEEDCTIAFRIGYFTAPDSPMTNYVTRIRLDRRRLPFGRAVSEASCWQGGTTPAAPDVVREPWYSTWYAFHQNVFADEIERECAAAAKLGMKGVILDDGWQTDDTNRGYAFCGDWEISKNRFPDMASHVRKVQSLGLKYIVWYSVPFVGVKSLNYERFKGKYLWSKPGEYAVLDPRFPEVRHFLTDTYAQALRTYGYDGFKLDFIDCFVLRGEDPAAAENYRGRDVKSLSVAVERLLAEIGSAVRAVKPEALLEFRQAYVGPVIRRYGNMFRASDCGGDAQMNRTRCVNLRLTSGRAAVHSDMLEWNVADTPENAAKQVLAVLFATIQCSVRLDGLPDSHRNMLKEWLEFQREHREALLEGEIVPEHPEAWYPVVTCTGAKERIVLIYNSDVVARVPTDGKTTWVVNATAANRVILDLGGRLERVSVPPAKHVKIKGGKWR